MLCCNIVYKLLYKNCLSYTCTTEKSDFSTFLIWTEQINYLDSCFKHFLRCRLLLKIRSFSVNWPFLFCNRRSSLINWIS